MYYYLITSGDYSDYGVDALVASEEPIDWPAKARAILEWANANLNDRDRAVDYWFLDTSEKRAIFAAVGLRLIEYTEYSIELRFNMPETEAEPNWRMHLDGKEIDGDRSVDIAQQ